MKLLLLLLILGSPVSAAPEVDLVRLAHVLAAIEGGRWDEPGGAACIGESAWRDRTPLPYRCSMDPGTALPVYVAHLVWIRDTLRLEGRSPTIARIALCWRWGITGSRRHPRDDYGERAAALYHDSGKSP